MSVPYQIRYHSFTWISLFFPRIGQFLAEFGSSGCQLQPILHEVPIQAFFCTKPKNSVLIFQELRSQKSSKTQFLPENSVPEQWIYENFRQKWLKKGNFTHFSPENFQIFRKLCSKKAKTQFSINS